ncbi:5-formyltetrahydrofolate cyclo-ligase, mitochondrial [Selaginella moellendorffii]|uniref:5-formyltetrahydrofolate cyclo-ligase, mitochondrial n=1 Tax=Selaginella moellendorffii TaxID=88036 RepID=UPI000D1CDA9D|nr:5-formyltetrahydrofolate cyclo-ligase, mitochondrial [Selaginella moellendorffii]XP_024545731.1 5-formyltetrahydrofolate cyclo-ligase, mitochondrial [Selaginella moellendorffii]|eukprot:XP_024545730.1 5-formyltetrahydrofolate cyclo-ligase, mitochondrial [Selaginella moellendorffii]
MAMAGAGGNGADVAALNPEHAIRQEKRQMRTAVRRKLREFAAAQRQIEDAAIQHHVLDAPWFKNSKRLCAYVSCAALREVDTTKIVAHIFNPDDPGQAKKLYLPRVQDKQSHMQMLHVKSYDDLVPNSMTILEPEPVDKSGSPREDVLDTDEPLDLLLLPGLAFDLSGRRLGRGGGYYDCLLSKILESNESKGWKRPLLVALAYSPQIVDGSVPVDETDVPVDALVRASGVTAISPYARQQILTDEAKF